jgi:hypothetical protein
MPYFLTKPAIKKRFKDFACPFRRSPLDLSLQRPNHMISFMQNLLIHPLSLLAQVEYSYSSSSQGQPPSPVAMIIGLLIALFLIVAMWKVFTKAGQPGWASIIPIYNLYVWCKIVGRPGWWIILLLIPFVNFIIGIILSIDLAKSFGKGVGFGIGLALLGVIFWPILGFGSAQYQGPSAAPGLAVSPPPQPA